MSKYQFYKDLEQKLQAELEKLEALKNDADVKATQELIAKLKEMIGELSCTDCMTAIIEIYGQAPVKSAYNALIGKGTERVSSVPRQPRPLKRWTNPETGESHEGRKAPTGWAEKYGKDKVDSWAEIIG